MWRTNEHETYTMDELQQWCGTLAIHMGLDSNGGTLTMGGYHIVGWFYDEYHSIHVDWWNFTCNVR